MQSANGEIARLQGIARRLRRHIVTMIGCGKPGHLGGSCSMADIVTVLYFHKMRLRPCEPKWPRRDRFVLSKGHCCLAQYAALGELGYIPKESFTTLKALGSILQGHPEIDCTPGVEAYTGSLGQGLSIACGMAMAAKLDNADYRVYCIVGDGEIDEGQIWAASMSAAFRKLDNLVVFLDNNGLCASGPIAKFFDPNPLADKWRSFGWNVLEIDGNDIPAVITALDDAETVRGKPTMIVAHTIKSKGVSFAEGNPAFHHGALTPEQFELALKELTLPGDL